MTVFLPAVSCVLIAAGTVDAGPTASAPAAHAAPVEPAFLDVAWNPAGLHTGRAELLVVTVPPGRAPVVSLEGTFNKKPVLTFPASPDGRTHYVLAAVGIEEEPGARILDLRAVLADQSVLAFVKPLPVVAAPYDERSLSVDKRFMQPKRKDRLRAAREARELTRVLRSSDAARLWRGNFARPAVGPETSPFGTRRTYNKRTRSRHLGWDLDGAVGDPITATARGRVALSADRFYSGGTVVLDHGQGLFSMYFHMSRRDVAVGEIVEKGQGLGLIGASGRVTGPHLHFTVKLAGESIDPRALLALDLLADAEPPWVPPAPQNDPPKAKRSSRREARKPVVETGRVQKEQRDVPEVNDVP